MNAFAVLILVALVAEYVLARVADLLNLRALEPELPPELAGVYDAERYRRSQEYARARTRFGLLPATVDLVALLLFWFLGGFDWLDRSLRSLELGPVGTGLLFIGALVLARTVLHLPFQYHSTFGIEERFGFNRSTRRTWVADLLKGLFLGVLLGAPLLAGVLFFFESAGALAWLWCWLAVTAFTLVVQFVAPTWILPLFNRFTPLEEGELREAVLDYARRVEFPLEGLFVIEARAARARPTPSSRASAGASASPCSTR